MIKIIYNNRMMIEYESQADSSFYCYFVKSGTVFRDSILYTIKCTPHFHRNVEFLFITDGTQTVNVNGEKMTLGKGDILFVDSYTPHSYDDCEAEAYILVLSTTFFDPFKTFFDGGVFPEIMDDKERNKEIFAFIEKWHLERGKKEDKYSTFLKCNELFRLMVDVYGVRMAVHSRQNGLVIDALIYIEENYCGPITLESCSKAIGYSKEYVSKQFNSVMGISFKSYVNSLRIKRFRSLEQTEKGSKQDLAAKCGFSSVTTFYRALSHSDEGETPN